MSPPINIRIAQKGDVQACVNLIEEKRIDLERYEPKFWKRSENAKELTTDWFGQLFEKDGVVALVAEEGASIRGFIIATPVPAPPVYSPGGPTALIDDYATQPGLWNTVGAELLSEAKEILRQRGFVQIVVVGVRKDEEKNRFLESANLSLASTWWTAGL